jgi:hypothetical protein
VSFGGYANVAPPFQDIKTSALWEGPVYGESYLGYLKWELVCMQTKMGQQAEWARFDTNSGTCMSLYRGGLVEEMRVIRSFEGSKVYTIDNPLLTIEDGEGHVNEVKIPNSYYVLSCPYQIISPPHWTQEVSEATDDSTGCIIYSNWAVLFWNGGT